MWLFWIAIVNILMFVSFAQFWPDDKVLLATVETLLLLLIIWLFQKEKRSRQLILNKIQDGFDCLHDGDFSISLPVEGPPQQQYLLSQFNQVIEKLRTERQTIYQRELLLDKMVNASTVVSILLNSRQQVVYLNQAAVRFFDNNKQLIGENWQQVVANKESILATLPNDHNAIINVKDSEQIEQSWLVSGHDFKLHGAPHKLLLLKPITNELQAQETQVWKKVIRVINHELNNSIAPISSMCHSGTMLSEKMQHPQLNMVFNTISARIKKLTEFINGYSNLARISLPNLAHVELEKSFNSVQQLYPFKLTNKASDTVIKADGSQLEQVFINLLKNAHEAVSGNAAPKKIEVELQQTSDDMLIMIRDNGSGMSQEQLRQAFLPSYTTKVTGSGIGLSVCKEIVENHKGSIELKNLMQGGLEVRLRLPIEAE